jgi:hypothetical protein
VMCLHDAIRDAVQLLASGSVSRMLFGSKGASIPNYNAVSV